MPLVQGKTASESPPGSPVNGMIPRITTAEVRDEKVELSKIPEWTPDLGMVPELLALLRRRAAEAEQAMEAYIAKEAAANRKEYAVALERLLLEDGTDAVVTASRPGVTTLPTRHMLGSAPRQSRKGAPPASSRRTAGSRSATAVPGAAIAPNSAVGLPMPSTAAAAVPAPPALMPMTPCGEDRPCSVRGVTVTSAFSSY